MPLSIEFVLSLAVADPDIKIGGGGGGAGLQKIFFGPFGPQFGLEIRGAGPPGPSPGSATD